MSDWAHEDYTVTEEHHGSPSYGRNGGMFKHTYSYRPLNSVGKTAVGGSGAAGAATGFAVAGPIGAVIGGIIGLCVGKSITGK